MGVIRNYDEFEKVASLVMDTDSIPTEVKASAYNLYTTNYQIPTEVIKVAREQATDGNIKLALDMVTAAKAYNMDILIDYGDNELAKHAGLKKWMEETGSTSAHPEKIAMVGAILGAAKGIGSMVAKRPGATMKSVEVGASEASALQSNRSTLGNMQNMQG